MDLKIMNYNILHGFHEMKEPWPCEKLRYKAAKRIIDYENPDIAILTEACYGRQGNYTGHYHDYPQLFSYPYGCFGEWGGYWGNQIMSKYPIVHSEILPSGDRTCLRGVVNVGVNLMIDVLHPHPHVRDHQKIELVKPLLFSRSEHYILTGDLNALTNPNQVNRGDLYRLIKPFEGDLAEGMIENLMNPKLLPYLKQNGLDDCCEQAGHTFPTTKLWQLPGGIMRIDNILASRNITVLGSYVTDGEDAEHASDHYPLCAYLRI